MSDFFMSMQSGSPSAGTLAAEKTTTHCAQPTTTIETDETAGTRTETTTWQETFYLPEDDETEIRQSMLDEYERSLGRHEATFTNLLRLYKNQKSTNMKLMFTLEQEKKKREKQQKKQKVLIEAAENLTKGLPKLTKKQGEKSEEMRDGEMDPKEQESEPRSPRGNAENLKRMIDELGQKMEVLRRRKDEADRKHAELKARQQAANQCDEKVLDAEINKLAREVDEAKAELSKFLKVLNEGFNKVSFRLQKEYQIQQDAATSKEVRWNLDQVLTDVKCLLGDKEKNEYEIDELKSEIDLREKKIQTAEELHKLLINETRTLLTIGNQKEAAEVNPENFAAVVKFVEETFEALINALKYQNNEVEQGNDKLKALEAEEDRRQYEFNQEKNIKQSKIDRIRRNVSELRMKNQRLKEELNRPTTAQGETEENPDIESHAVNKIMVDMAAADNQQNKALENRLQRAKNKNAALRSMLKDLTSAINDLEDKRRQRQNELENLKERVKAEADQDGSISRELEQQIEEAQQRADQSEKALADLLNRINDPSEYRKEKDSLLERDKHITKRVKILNDNMRQADADRNRLNSERIEKGRKCDELNNKIYSEQGRENDLNNDLNDVRDKIDEIDKALSRERERNLLIERERRYAMMQPMEFIQTTVTRMCAASSFGTDTKRVYIRNEQGQITGNGTATMQRN